MHRPRRKLVLAAPVRGHDPHDALTLEGDPPVGAQYRRLGRRRRGCSCPRDGRRRPRRCRPRLDVVVPLRAPGVGSQVFVAEVRRDRQDQEVEPLRPTKVAAVDRERRLPARIRASEAREAHRVVLRSVPTRRRASVRTSGEHVVEPVRVPRHHAPVHVKGDPHRVPAGRLGPVGQVDPERDESRSIICHAHSCDVGRGLAVARRIVERLRVPGTGIPRPSLTGSSETDKTEQGENGHGREPPEMAPHRTPPLPRRATPAHARPPGAPHTLLRGATPESLAGSRSTPVRAHPEPRCLELPILE